MRVIEEIVKDLERAKVDLSDWISEYREGWNDAINCCIKIIRFHMLNPNWVEVKYEKPNAAQEILCSDGESVFLVNYDPKYGFTNHKNVVAWQPKPDPYEIIPPLRFCDKCEEKIKRKTPSTLCEECQKKLREYEEKYHCVVDLWL